MQYDRQAMPLLLPVSVDFSATTSGTTQYTYTAERDFNIRDISLFTTEAIVTGGHVISIEVNGVEKATFLTVALDPVGTVYTPVTAIKTSVPIAVAVGDTIEVINKTVVAANGAGQVTLWIQEEN